MKKPKVVLMDLDGTVYEGSSPVPGIREVVQKIRSNNVRLLFFTNNSEKTRNEISEKLNNMGIFCIEEDIVSSGYVAVDLIKNSGYKNIFVCGSENFKKEFVNSGQMLVDEFHCETLVIGMDSSFDYQKLTSAINAAMNAECIIACNLERTFPVGCAMVRPGCGAMVASIEYCSGKKVDIIVGKPEKYMVDYVCELENVIPEQILVVGDTYESDIKMAIDVGAHNILIGQNLGADYNVEKIIDIINILNVDFDFDD